VGSPIGLRTCFELQATHRWAAQLYLHPTTDRLGSPACAPIHRAGDPLICFAANLLASGSGANDSTLRSGSLDYLHVDRAYA
jgi:hypothetical protein